MKIDKELKEIWKERNKDTIGGVRNYDNLSLKEKSRIFDLIMENKI